MLVEIQHKYSSIHYSTNTNPPKVIKSSVWISELVEILHRRTTLADRFLVFVQKSLHSELPHTVVGHLWKVMLHSVSSYTWRFLSHSHMKSHATSSVSNIAFAYIWKIWGNVCTLESLTNSFTLYELRSHILFNCLPHYPIHMKLCLVWLLPLIAGGEIGREKNVLYWKKMSGTKATINKGSQDPGSQRPLSSLLEKAEAKSLSTIFSISTAAPDAFGGTE